MAARHHIERAILRSHLADHQQGGDNVVIAVRGEEEILMPFHLGGGVRQLGVNFAVVKTGAVAADQLRGNGRHPRIQRSMAIGLGDLRRGGDPAQRRMVGSMVAFDIETRPPVKGFSPRRRVTAALLDPAVEIALQRGDVGGGKHPFDHQITLLMKLLNLPLRNHSFSSSRPDN